MRNLRNALYPKKKPGLNTQSDSIKQNYSVPNYNSQYVPHCIVFLIICKAIPIKCFVSHRPPSREGGSVGRAKKKKKKGMIT